MNDPAYQQLVETAWRRELTPGEARRLSAILARNPLAETHWRAESRLNSALGRLSDRPLSSNFTSQVLKAVEQANRQTPSPALGKWGIGHFWRWQPLAWGTVGLALLIGVVTLHRLEERQKMIADLASIPAVPDLPPAEILQDFDAILHLGQVPGKPDGRDSFSDEELLAALK